MIIEDVYDADDKLEIKESLENPNIFLIKFIHNDCTESIIYLDKDSLCDLYDYIEGLLAK